MKFCIFVNILSPHQLPLAAELVNLFGREQVRYVYTEEIHSERVEMGWNENGVPEVICLKYISNIVEPELNPSKDWVENAPFLLTGFRDFELFTRRSKKGLITFYMSERWFKPIRPFKKIPWVRDVLQLSGRFRMLVPSYYRMAKLIGNLISDIQSHIIYLPIGLWAARDMAWITNQKIESCQTVPCGKIVGAQSMVLWGDFVAPSSLANRQSAVSPDEPLRVLWVGRMIDWKRVDTLVRAVKYIVRQWGPEAVSLTLVGDGPERCRLIRLAEDLPISFFHSLSINAIRDLMRSHNVYVMPSDGGEGWGCALNEALEEGMWGIGTYESGAGVTILPSTHLFHAGDVRALVNLLMSIRRGDLPRVPIGNWTAGSAARRLVQLCDDLCR